MIEARQPEAASAMRNVQRVTSRLAGTRLWESEFLSQEERNALENAIVSVRSVDANTDIVREGARTDTLFIVATGWACRYMTTADGNNQLPAILVIGDVGNLDSLLFDRLDYGVRTLTSTRIVALPRDRVLALAAQYPGIARTFTWLALIENITLSQWALSLGRRSALEGLAHLLCELSVRLDGEDGDGSRFAFPLTQQQVADALGLTPVHVNRTMRQLRAEGLVVIKDKVATLPNVTGLRRLCGFDPGYLHVGPPRKSNLYDRGM